MRLKIIACLTLLIMGWTSVEPAFAANEPEQVRQIITDAVAAVVKILAEEGLEKDLRRAKILTAVEPLFDFASMAKLSLGRKHWPLLDAEQQTEFVSLFKKQLEKTYLDKAEQFGDEEVEVGPAEAIGSKIHVNTVVLSKGEDFGIKYKLYKAKDGWQIYDVEIEGVSVISSYRSQYDDQLRTGTVAELLQAMREKVDPKAEEQWQE
jgi:phospholipid transport system substrate-binding protein